MGMLLIYCRVSPQNAEALRKQPALIHPFLDREEVEVVEGVVKRSFFSRLFGRGAVSTEELPMLEPRREDDEGDADKAWQAIHFLLTGTADGGSFPQSFILYGGRQVGDEDVGYGPARIFSPAEVKEIAEVLTSHSQESLRARYDGKMMDEELVYPQGWGRETDEHFDYVWENFVMLRDFVLSVRADGLYLMLYLS